MNYDTMSVHEILDHLAIGDVGPDYAKELSKIESTLRCKVIAEASVGRFYVSKGGTLSPAGLPNGTYFLIPKETP